MARCLGIRSREEYPPDEAFVKQELPEEVPAEEVPAEEVPAEQVPAEQVPAEVPASDQPETQSQPQSPQVKREPVDFTSISPSLPQSSGEPDRDQEIIYPEKEKIYQCEKCNESFAYRINLDRHKISHLGNDEEIKAHIESLGLLFLSDWTENVIKTTEEMRKLLKTSENEDVKPQQSKEPWYYKDGKHRPYQCNICSKKFTTFHHLRDHTTTIHNREKTGRERACDYCGREFRSKNDMERHKARYPDRACIGMTGIKCRRGLTVGVHKLPVKCKYCGDKFHNSSNYHRHMRTHDDVRDFQCNFCNYKFTRKEHLRRHMKQHTGVGEVLCNICGRDFRDVSAMKRHQRTHMGLPYRP